MLSCLYEAHLHFWRTRTGRATSRWVTSRSSLNMQDTLATQQLNMP